MSWGSGSPAEARVLAVVALAVAVILSLVLVRWMGRRFVPASDVSSIRVFGTVSPVLTWLNRTAYHLRQNARDDRARHAGRGHLGSALELLVIGLWAAWISRALLNFDPRLWPIGREFGIDIYAFHFWDLVQACGLCSLWNGMLNGGSPFLADPFTGHLHPLPGLATLAAGVVNGAKITVVVSLFLAGVGQWWIARLIGLSRWSRVWTALVATSGAHLAGRFELGSVADPLSAAAATLALAGSLDLALNRNRKAALRLAALLGLALVAGHGYYQIALLAWSPWILVLILKPDHRPDRVWREFLLAGALAVFLAAFFLVPFAHFWPAAAKSTDLAFESSQPLEYIPLNLVVHDWDFYATAVLGKTPYPYLHPLFIGWAAVVLAVFGLAKGRREDRRLLLCLSLGALWMMWLASGVPFRWVAGVFPTLAALRHVAHLAGMAIPAILGLAGYGLDRVLQLPWPRITLDLGRRESGAATSVSLAWLLAIPLLASLRTADRFDQSFLVTDDRTGVYQGIETLGTPSLEWVSVPFGEHYWIEPALAAGFKLTHVATPWWWESVESPGPLLEATRESRGAEIAVCCQMNEVPVYHYPANEYATVETADGVVACTAQGRGGDIRVTCPRGAGRLVLREHAWSGWTGKVNGRGIPLEPGPWLSVAVPTGPVEARFRYLPLDALVGVLLSVSGIILLMTLWIRASRPPATPPAPVVSEPPAYDNPVETVLPPPTRRSSRRAPASRTPETRRTAPRK